MCSVRMLGVNNCVRQFNSDKSIFMAVMFCGGRGWHKVEIIRKMSFILYITGLKTLEDEAGIKLR